MTTPPVLPQKYGSTENVCQEPTIDSSEITDIENMMPVDGAEMSFIQKIQSRLLSCGTCLANLKLEIVLFLFTFSNTLTNISSTSMIVDKVCLVHFGYSPDICSDLENHTVIKTSVERLATNYQLGHSLIQMAPAALLACFIGPWSDHYGRKFPVLLAIFGMFIDALGSTVCAYFLETRVEYFFIPPFFTGIFGGSVSVLAVFYSYASDSTPLEKRTMKYAYLEMAAGFSVPLGAAAGGWIYNFLGYPSVFLFSASGMCLSFIWIIFLMKETRGLDNDDHWSNKLRTLFSCQSFKDSFAAISKERPHQGRKQIALLIFSMCFVVITMNSTGDISYLYAHHQFGWGNTKYSTFISIYSVIGITVLIIIIPVMRYFRLGDPIIGLMGTTSLLIRNLGVGLAWKPVIYHIASVFNFLGGCASFAARSRISKLISNEDVGKIFSFVATAESLLPVLTSVLMTQIFKASLDVFPGAPYITLASFLLLPLVVFSWMVCLPIKTTEDSSSTEEITEDALDTI